jgi:hypothetical protein
LNKYLIAASCLSVFTFCVHVFVGGPEIHEPLLASNASDLVRAVGSVIWHAISAMLFLNSCALAYAARNNQTAIPVVLLVVAQYLAFVLLFTGYGFARFGTVLVMPQWTGFLTISLLAIWGIKFGRAEPQAGGNL